MASNETALQPPREDSSETPNPSATHSKGESSDRSRPVSNTSQAQAHDQAGDEPPQQSLERPGTPLGRRVPLRSHKDVSDEDVSSPWAHKTMLTLDGGGIRGYSSLLILNELMSKIRELEQQWPDDGAQVKSSGDYPWRENESSDSDSTDSSNQFYPCHYFDYVAGTSTGGLSAIMLGRLRMSVDEALTKYVEFGTSVFGRARWFSERSVLYFPRAKYSSHRTMEAIVDVIHSKLQEKDPESDRYTAAYERFSSGQDQTRIIVIAFSKDKKKGIDDHYLFRSYDHDANIRQSPQKFQPRNPGPACRERLCEVARATSSAPTYFEETAFMNRKFLDGGFGANNPGEIAYQEVHHMHAHPLALCISIGTGVKTPTPRKKKRDHAREKFTPGSRGKMPRKQFFKKYLELNRFLKEFAANTEEIANKVKLLTEVCGTEHRRFNVEHGLGGVALDDWRPTTSGEQTLADITHYTNNHLALEDVQKDLDFCAEMLVNRRRERAATERWEKFATDVGYHCPGLQCKDKVATRFKERAELRRHYKHNHREVSPSDMEVFLDAGRVRKGPKPQHMEVTIKKLKKATPTGLSNGDTRSSPPGERQMTNGA